MSASGPGPDGPDEQEPLEELFGTVFDLAGEIASRISRDHVEARLRRTLQEAGHKEEKPAQKKVSAERADQPAAGLRTMTPSLAGVSGELQRGSLRESVMTAGALAIADPDPRELVPHSARVWNYWLGGKGNYAVDRAAGDQFSAIYPGIVDIARADRAFLGRVVRYLAGEAGVRQFLDVGTGLPTADNTHQVAQRVAPESRIVYVDNDPLVLAHARALLTSSPEGATYYVDANMTNPDKVLQEAARWLDLTQPVALTFMGVLGHVTDHDEARAIVSGLLYGLASGSYLAINDSVNTSEALEEALRVYEASGAVPYRTRSVEQFASYFDGLELVDPGVVVVDDWRPDPGTGLGPEIPQMGAVGRKK